MGHAVDIFTSQPPACYHCAVCHDVLQSAVSFKECGHSFCEECAKACLRSKTRPNCRVEVMGFIPNFIVREAIGSLEVKCLNGGDASNKRARGNDGEAVPVLADVCDWTGKCNELQNHEKVCDFKMIRCSVNGCNHECLRKDMNGHLSGGDGFLLHLNLMKRSITERYGFKMDVILQRMEIMKKNIMSSHKIELEDMKTAYDEKMEEMKEAYDDKLEDMERKIEDMERSMNQVSELKDQIESLKREIAEL
eukprot:scaffold237766_cov36-Cyclotella_meneghiniana.AAC.1